MKLLDPINGLKFSQMHYLLHASFFLAMFFIDRSKLDAQVATPSSHGGHGAHGGAQPPHTDDDYPHDDDIDDLDDVWKTTPIQDMTVAELKQEIASKKQLLARIKARNINMARESRLKTNWDYLAALSSHGAAETVHEEELTPEEEHELEKWLFDALQWTHLAVFLAQMITQYAKKKGYHDFAQLLQALMLCFGQTPFFYCIYFCKTRLEGWEGGQWNELRIFLFLECLWFFEWIFIGVSFLAFAYLFKLRSITKDDSLDEKDDNPWNDKFSDDYMRYMKGEMYSFCHVATKFFFDIQIGFYNYYNIGAIGVRNMYPTRTLFAMLIVDRLILTGIYFYAFISRKHVTSYTFKTLYIIYLVMHIACFAGVFSIYFTTNQLEGESLICVVWVRVVMFEALVDSILLIRTLLQIGLCKNQEKALEDYKNIGAQRSQIDEGNSGKTEDQIKKQKEKKEDLIKKIKAKNKLDFEEDFTSMAVFCYLKSNVTKFMITPEKRAQVFHQALAIQANTMAMLVIICYAIITNEQNRYDPSFAHNFPTFLVKIACVMALHFVLYPEVAKGLNIMKLANQHHTLFVDFGASVAYLLGLTQVSLATICEFINLFMLTYQHTIAHCIIHFVAFKIVVDLSNIYFESLMNTKLKVIVEHQYQPEMDDEYREKNKKTRDIFSERTCFHKIARLIYKVYRCMFVSLNFYFTPFIVVYWQFLVKPLHGGHAAGGHGGH